MAARREAFTRENIYFLPILGLMLLTAFIGIYTYSKLSNGGGVLGVINDDSDIGIDADVYGCDLTLTIHPEKRLPASNNWATDLSISIYDGLGVLKGTATGTSDNAGTLSMDLCSEGIYLVSGTYTFKVRGTSHLRKAFDPVASFDIYSNTIDLSIGGDELLAGETSLVFDNYINSLDLATQIKRLYSSDSVTDLNRDGTVNSLDISNTLYNLFVAGD